MITSVQNEYVKNIIKIKKLKCLKEDKLYVIEGEHLVIEAMKYNLVTEVIITPTYNKPLNIKTTIVSNEVMKKITTLASIPNIIAVCKSKEESKIVGNRLLLLDNILDPGNLGTIIRTAKAFNIDTIIIGDDCVSLYNDKVLRSTQGLHFSQNIIRTNLLDIIPSLKENGYKILSTVVNKGTNIRTIKEDKLAIIFGNEGKGVKNKLLELSTNLVTIPMNNDCESLNVAIATAICLYELDNE